MDEETREILRQTIGETLPPHDVAAATRCRVVPLRGVELDVPSRDSMPEPPDFD